MRMKKEATAQEKPKQLMNSTSTHQLLLCKRMVGLAGGSINRGDLILKFASPATPIFSRCSFFSVVFRFTVMASVSPAIRGFLLRNLPVAFARSPQNSFIASSIRFPSVALLAVFHQ